MKDIEFYTTTLGALLHDVGKFRQRADHNPQKQDHSMWGKEWLESISQLPKGVSVCAEWHHRTKYADDIVTSNLTLITDMADNYASGSERETKKNAVFAPVTASLKSILSELQLNDKLKPKPAYFPLVALDDQVVFPKPLEEVTNSQQQYAKLWSEFEKEFKAWAAAGCYIDSLLPLLEKYMAFIPSETLIEANNPQTDPDISLFDHLKSSAAIASCIYHAVKEKKKGNYNQDAWVDEIRDQQSPYFKLVGGDLSGVQKFIYTISSKGALKTLRARSFFLEVFSEHVISQFLESANLSRANVIYSGGARFYILAPNTNEVNEAIKRVRKAANNWLWENFRGQLALIIESVDFSGNAFLQKEIPGLWGKVSQILNESKRRKLADHLEELLTPFEPLVVEACDACHRDDIQVFKEEKKEEEFKVLCSFCRNMYELGATLSSAKFINTVVKQPEKSFIEIFNAFDDQPLYLAFADHPAKTDKPVYVLHGALSECYAQMRLAPLSSGVFVRLNKDLEFQPAEGDKNAPATLESIAKQACGKPLIAGLRMDVDNLGAIFQKGLTDNKKTFTRMAMLSRQLSLFFRKYLNSILAGRVPEDFPLTDFSAKNPRKNGRNVHIIYSGGDDLFLIGAWDDVAESAIDIHNAFAAFSGYNPSLTISGGFVVQKHNFPLYRLAEIAHKAEEMAKSKGRDRLTLFYDAEFKDDENHSETMEWIKLDDYLINPLRLLIRPEFIKVRDKRYYEHNLINSSHINRLYQLMSRYTRDGMLYLPALAYMISRIKNFQNKHPELTKLLIQPHSLPKMRNAILWLNLASRKGGN